MDARELIRRRKEETKAASELERLDQQDDNELRTNTGRNFRFVGRDPATGEMVARSGDGTLYRGKGVSNTELTSESPMQVLDNGGKLQTFNFSPTKPDPLRDRTQSSTETMIGHVAVLFDCVVDDGGEETAPKSSCKTVDDIWALYAIVRYVKIARSMVLFSFPKQNNAPYQYACPRYEFGQAEGGVWSCIQTNDPSAPYATATECQQKNKVTCDPIGNLNPGTPIYPDQEDPNLPAKPRFVTTNYPAKITTRIVAVLNPAGFLRRDHVVFQGMITGGSAKGTTTYAIWDTSEPLPSNTETSLIGLYTYGNRIYYYSGRSTSYMIATQFFSTRTTTFNAANNRLPRCGDTYEFIDLLADVYESGYTTVVDTTTGDGETFPPNGTTVISNFRENKQLYTYQKVYDNGVNSLFDWLPASSSSGCGNYVASSGGVKVEEKDEELPQSVVLKECEPPVVINPSKISREFWVGGHIETPIKLFEINEEDEYIWYGTLTSDGYIITIKYGRELKNGVEVWCKVKQFKTSNFTDWRTVEYTGSHSLNPPLPSGVAGSLINTKNDRSNLTEDGIHEISLTQTLIGADGLERTLKDELFLRPDPPLNDTTIMAEMTYTPNNGNPQTIPTEIFRIVDVIPTNLDIVTGSCFPSVKDVDIQLSPLYLNV